MSKLLDRNTFEHVKTKMDEGIDDVSDKYLIHKTFLGKKEEEINAHEKRLKKTPLDKPTEVRSTQDASVIHKSDLEKGNIEVQLPRKN